MWSALFELAVVVVAAWLVWRFIASMLPRREQRAEPGSNRGDPSLVPAWLRPRPKSGAGAVAVAEPDGDDEELAYHPSKTGRSSRTSMWER